MQKITLSAWIKQNDKEKLYKKLRLNNKTSLYQWQRLHCSPTAFMWIMIDRVSEGQVDILESLIEYRRHALKARVAGGSKKRSSQKK